MSRPKPTVILSHTIPLSGKAEQVLAAEAIYAVFYDGKPINLKTVSNLLLGNNYKYKKSSFPNSGHAFNLAEKLNKMFKTDLFAVFKLTEGMLITEDDDLEDDSE